MASIGSLSDLASDAGAQPAVGGVLRLHDNRVVSKPRKLGSDGSEWADFQFELRNFMMAMNIQFIEDMRLAAAETMPVSDGSSTEVRQRSVQLYAVLAECSKDRARMIVRGEEDTMNGFEVWRQLCAEFQPLGQMRKLAVLRHLTKAETLINKSPQQFYTALLAYEQEIKVYEKMPNTRFDPDLLKAIVLDAAPEDLKVHLQLLGGERPYDDMRSTIENYLRNRGLWNTGGSAGGGTGIQPMDVGYVGGGKGGNKFQAQCGRCGGTDHYSNKCPHVDTTCKNCGKKGHLARCCKSGTKDSKDKGGGKGKGKKSKDGKWGQGKNWSQGQNDKYKDIVCYVCGDKGHPAWKCPKRLTKPMDVDAAMSSAASVSSAATLPVPRGTNLHGAVLVQTVEEQFEQDWLLGAVQVDQEEEQELPSTSQLVDTGMEEQIPVGMRFATDMESSFGQRLATESGDSLVAAVSEQRKRRVMIDSGAAKSLLKNGDFQAPLAATNARFRAITGHSIPVAGQQKVHVTTNSDRRAVISGATGDTLRSVLAVTDMVENGNTVVFSPGGSWISQVRPPVPQDAEMLVKEDRVWHLEVQENPPGQGEEAILAPLGVEEPDPAEFGDDSQRQDRQRFADGEPGSDEKDEWDAAYDAAVMEHRVLPFDRFSRYDAGAKRYRRLRLGDPARLSQLIRRVTVDLDTRELIADEFKADKPSNFMWGKALPGGGARRIKTTYYTYIGEDRGSLIELVQNAQRDTSPKQLAVPEAPSEEERRRHEVTHTPYAAWCPHCVAGRSKGPVHKALVEVKDNNCEADYTYYTHTGFGYSKEAQPGAVCAITFVHRRLQKVCSTVVVRKGVWPFAVELVTQFLLEIGEKTYQVRGDPEPSLLQFLRAVKKRLSEFGVTAEVEATTVGSHQSIGAAEVTHGIVGGYIRTYSSVVKEATDISIEPCARLFVWLLRWATFVVNHFHIRSDGLTTFYKQHGTEYRQPVAIFGEAVLMKMPKENNQSKAKSRWKKVVWVGISDKDSGHIGLDETGYLVSRECMRLSEGNRWSKQLLATAAGLPWSRHEGAGVDKRFAIRSSGTPVVALPEAKGDGENGEKQDIESGGGSTPRLPPSQRSDNSMNVPSLPRSDVEYTPVDEMLQTPRQGGQRFAADHTRAKRGAETEIQDLYEQTSPGPEAPTTPARSATGATGEEISLSRSAAWQPDGEGAAKRWKQVDQELVLGMVEFLQAEVPDSTAQVRRDHVIASMEEYACRVFEVGETEKLEHRKEEIIKIGDFEGYVAIPKSEIPPGVRAFGYRWVDTDSKSRLTLKDLKVFHAKAGEGTERGENRNCPTPSEMENNLFDWLVVHMGWSMKVIDVCSAFLHAGEENPDIYMETPPEWYLLHPEEVREMVWHVLGNLYGRTTAGATFRDFWEAIVCSVPGEKMKRLELAPCYYMGESKTTLGHHIDDARLTGTDIGQARVEAHLSSFMLLKVSEQVVAGVGYKYLGSTKVRLKNGWVTIPDPKHMLKIQKNLQLDTVKVAAASPGVKRTKAHAEVESVHEGTQSEYRSNVGILTFAVKDVEVLAFAAKECSRGLHDPTPECWMDLCRIARFMIGKQAWGTHQYVQQSTDGVVQLVVTTDSDWGSDADARSTSGVRITVGGFLVYRQSQTQPGLPAMSSGEAELRAMSRGIIVGLHCKQLLEEMGFKVYMVIEGDATAALEASSKLSIGRMRHLRVADSFVRLVLKTKLARSRKIDTKENPSDLLTKHVTKQVLDTLLEKTGWHEVTEAFRTVAVKQVNKLNDIKDSREIEKKHRDNEKVRVSNLGQTLLRASLVACFVQQSMAQQCEVVKESVDINGVALGAHLILLMFGVGLGWKLREFRDKIHKAMVSRDVGTMSQCTYMRKNLQPRFQVLASSEQG